MIEILNAPIRGYFSFRDERLVTLINNQLQTQEVWLNYLVKNGASTQFGKKYGMSKDMTYFEFASEVPLQDYVSLLPYIERIMKGEDYILWNSKINWMAKSSGTTAGKSKYIPVSEESLKFNNFLAARDSLTFFCEMFPETEIFSGKGITLGGSFHEMGPEAKVKCGDVSAILMNNMPILGEFLKAPDKEILLNDNWNEKLRLIAENTYDKNITSLSGVPSWFLLVLKEVLNIAGKKNILEVWPNLEVFFHGGVGFKPYEKEYRKLIPSDNFFYMNMYNASEGFFGFQFQRDCSDLLLLTDNGVFYEFIPIDAASERRGKPVPLTDVEMGQLYAMVITTPSGLWRYEIGDTIMFTSTNPYSYRITGRTTQYINTFGEELIVDNADKAIFEACEKTGAILKEYTAAPIYLGNAKEEACHEWLIEFTRLPDNMELFTSVLDTTLKKLNSDYEAKRTGDLILHKPKISVMPDGTFIKWLDAVGKLGGQFKVPRLQNDRKIVDAILQLL